MKLSHFAIMAFLAPIALAAQQPPAAPPANPITTAFRTRIAALHRNIAQALEQAGASPADVVKCSVFLKNAQDFSAMNEVYAQFFGETRPARTTVEAQFHQTEMKVEIDCVAYKPLATK